MPERKSSMRRRGTARSMSYIDRDLLPGEHLVYRTRLYWLMFAGPVLLTALVLLPIAWRLFNDNQADAAWAPIALGAILVGIAALRRQSSDFAVTNRRVVTKVGILNTRSIELLLDKIEGNRRQSERAGS